MSIFSERLQATRKKHGLSSQAVANLLNVTQRAYLYYEQGKREPPYDKLVILAQELNVSTDYLLGLTDR